MACPRSGIALASLVEQDVGQRDLTGSSVPGETDGCRLEPPVLLDQGRVHDIRIVVSRTLHPPEVAYRSDTKGVARGCGILPVDTDGWQNEPMRRS